ncbi:MAG TPA: delta-60 repeat domain-containing protein [Actinomycetota bacterium]|nr:delta-60 repeat domain-containing protein [Actinomycetota bacterium]
MTSRARCGRVTLTLAVVAGVMCAARAAAAPGDLDRTFGGDGRVVTNLTGSSDSVADVAIQANGRIVVVGRTPGRRYGKFALARYRPDGRLDQTFGGDGIVTTNMAKREDAASAVTIQTDGRIVVVGTASIRARRVFAIARYDPDGTLDAGFGNNGKARIGFTQGGDDAAADVAVQPDGRIVVVGSSFDLDRFALARLDPDGTLDPTFHADGKVTTSVSNGADSAEAVAIQPDGKIVVVGESWTLSGWDGIDVARYETDGQVDPTFGIDGVATVDLTEGSDGAGDMARAVAIQPDGKIVVAGDAGGAAEFTSGFGLARFDDDGTPDASFHGDGTVVTNFTRWDDSASDLAIQADGKIVVVGVAGYSWDTVATFALVRYAPDGTLDGSFGDHGKLRTRFRARIPDDPVGIVGAWARGVAIDADGRIVAAGGVDRVVDGHLDGRFALARYRVG